MLTSGSLLKRGVNGEFAAPNGDEVLDQFFDILIKEGKNKYTDLKERFHKAKTFKLSPDDELKFQQAKECYLCEKPYTSKKDCKLCKGKELKPGEKYSDGKA